MQWFDAGVNLLDRRFDVDEVIAASRQAGVEKLCLITTHPDEWERAAELHQRYPQTIYYTLGIHPHHAKEAVAAHFSQLREMAHLPGMVAVGECGLDFNRMFSPRESQLAVFEQQLQIAAGVGKPVYLHERDAFGAQCMLLQKYMPQLTRGGIAHCFTGNTEQIKAYLAFGLYIGITGWVCDDKRGQDLQEAINQLPMNKIVLETDAPYLFPKTLRPRQRNNTPATVPHIGSEIARRLNISQAQICQASYANTCKLFDLN